MNISPSVDYDEGDDELWSNELRTSRLVIDQAQQIARQIGDSYVEYKKDAQDMINKMEKKIHEKQQQLRFCEKENSELCEENALVKQKNRVLEDERSWLRSERESLLKENNLLQINYQNIEKELKASRLAQNAKSLEVEKLQDALAHNQTELSELKMELDTLKNNYVIKCQIEESKLNKKPSHRYSDNFDCSFDLRVFNSELLKETTEMDNSVFHQTNYFMEKFVDNSVVPPTDEENKYKLKSVQGFMNIIHKMKNEYELLKTDWSKYCLNESCQETNNNQLNLTYFDNQFKTMLDALFCVILEDNNDQPCLNKLLTVLSTTKKYGRFGAKKIKSKLKQRSRMNESKTSKRRLSHEFLKLEPIDQPVEGLFCNQTKCRRLFANKKLMRFVKWMDHSDLGITLLFLLSLYIFDIRHIWHFFGKLYESISLSRVNEAKLPF